ncbi:MAG: TIGR03905 family TSCPD domain-containing protein [Clostridia bacterium]|nr:TIGR03905 family TSCPD domain-containing protein [Clostridia bacterium]
MYTYKPSGVCSKEITFDLDGDKVKNVSFTGGCNGNLKAIARVVEGMSVEEIEEYFLGLKCGMKNTSCSEQLAIGVRKALDKANGTGI